jgi:hypothetical protein
MTNEQLKHYTDLNVNLSHAVQSGVQACISLGLTHDCTPKHLRVGINVAMCDHSALAGLLIEKGLITEEEYFLALNCQLGKEVKEYERKITEVTGKPCTLI